MGDFNTFSIGSNSKTHDETYRAIAYSKVLKTKHHMKKMTAENSIALLDKILISAGEPIGDSSILPTWILSNIASSKATVILSGDGADELFFGYNRFQSSCQKPLALELSFLFKIFLRGIDRLILMTGLLMNVF